MVYLNPFNPFSYTVLFLNKLLEILMEFNLKSRTEEFQERKNSHQPDILYFTAKLKY